MTRHDDALEQMRSANPLMGTHDIDADELDLSRSTFEERRLAMTTRTPTQRDRLRTRHEPNWSPVLIAASVFLLVLGLFGAGTVMLRGSEADAPMAEEPETIVTTRSVTTIPEESVAVVPEASTTEPGVRVLSNTPEYGTNLVLGADGLPMILSTTRTGDEFPGTARLFRCLDMGCDEFTVEVLDYEPGSGWPLISGAPTDMFIVGPNGDLYLTLESIDAVHSIGRYDGDTVEPLPILSNWPTYQPPAGPADPMPFMPLPAAFSDQGYPAFVTFHGALPATANLLVCSDSLCEGFIEIEIDTATFHDFSPEVSLDGDTARVVYSTGEPTEPLHPEEIGMTESISEVKIAMISDLYGTPVVDVEIVDIDPRATGEFDPQMRPISAYFEEIYDPDQYAAYLEEEQRITDEGLEDIGVDEPEPLGTNLIVERCHNSACTSVDRTVIATYEVPMWYLNSLELEVAPDGTVLVAVAGVGEFSETGMWLHVFPDGELGPGVEPLEGHVVPVVGWDAR